LGVFTNNEAKPIEKWELNHPPEIGDKCRNLGHAISVRTSYFIAGILVTVELNKGKVTLTT